MPYVNAIQKALISRLRAAMLATAAGEGTLGAGGGANAGGAGVVMVSGLNTGALGSSVAGGGGRGGLTGSLAAASTGVRRDQGGGGGGQGKDDGGGGGAGGGGGGGGGVGMGANGAAAREAAVANENGVARAVLSTIGQLSIVAKVGWEGF